ncbi:bromo and FHA domain-containing protein DDB_G0267958-like [Cottoperca gobio]|uniref:Bromo and FHA domain-containing protein DDB_G0267958-like n=1 Tax=Cottoperca gobio TaxID=56716 RepID=A0A6J2PR12_COTGO|nr:bromo and FHA domain-containing protein DDB_G0267958-like [Cottoperca gobio]
MATENAETNAGNDEETVPPSETNEHDYAHASAAANLSSMEATSSSGTPAADGGVTPQESFTTVAEPECSLPGQPTLQVELPEPVVGAEVDCPGGNDVEDSPPPEAEEDPQKIEASELGTTVPPAVRGGRRRPKRPEDKNCSACKSEFERQGRSFNRRAVYTFTTPETVQWTFPDASVHDKSFLCETCAQVIRSRCKRRQSGKRTLWVKPPQTKQSEVRDKKKKGRRMGKKSKAALLVSKSCYKAAFKMLWSAKGARKPMMEFWSKQLKEEMKALTRQTDNPFHQKVSSRKPLSSFPWRRCLNWAQDKAPLVTSCLTSLFPDINTLSKSSNQMSEEQAQTLLERRTVVALSIPLFTRNIWKNNFLQAALGAELRLQGCSGSALDALNTMGLCQNKDTVRLLLHRLRNGKKAPTQNGRQRMKMKLEQLKGEQMTDAEEEEDIEEEEEEEEEEDEEDEEEEEEVEEEEEDDDDDEEEEEEMEMAVEEVEVEEVPVGVEEEEDQAVEEKAEIEKKRRKKKAKKLRKEEKRKERGKRKVKEREGEEDDEGSEQKKRRVVVVRLGLLKGHSEVGRSDLSAP